VKSLARYLSQFFATVLLTAVSFVFCTNVSAHPYFENDTIVPVKITDTLKFPISDRRGDVFTNPNKNPFDLKDPKNIRDSIEYDPKTKQYFIVEKIGTHYYRKPTYLTFDEYMRIKSQQLEDDYFRKRADMLSALNKKKPQPKLFIGETLFNRLFGNAKPDIKPQGNVDITAGYQGQNVQNPTLPESARKTGGFDFQESANVSVLGNIGNKLKLPISYNTQANFDFMNQLKLDYTGGPDEIIKKIEAGNTSFTTKGTLITSAQSLFGLKTQLQFGKLSVTAVIATQRSQSQSVGLQGGAATTNYQFKADDYDENRNFLLAQYFKNNFNKAMQKLPIVTSQVQILRMEVWVTNRNGVTGLTQTRNVVGLMDLGETSPYNPNIHAQTGLQYPFNDANDEYRRIINDPISRGSSTAIEKLNSIGLTQVQDFEQVYAKKLDSTAYTFSPQIGFITLTQQLQPDDVLAVAYQYSYNGKIYQVGEFSQDIPPDTSTGNYAGSSKVLYLKLLKATSQRTNLPIWNLMMKNVYTLKTGTGNALSNIQSAGFQLNILYDEPSKGQKRYLPAGDKVGVPLLSVLNLDRLDSHNDPQPDGVFDYLEGYTIISSQGRVIFPVLEPFGRDLDSLAFKNSQSIAPNYVFYKLYDTIKAVAQTFANVDRYIISGVAKGQASSDIALGGINVPQGSVVVTAGGQTLREGVDYTVDYNLGTVKIINQAIINSGVPTNVKFENNASFGTQQRSFTGVRLDYLAKNTTKESLNIGGTFERLKERPYFTKTNYGEDPIDNVMYGLDVNYRSQMPQVTRFLNKLYSTKESSTLTAYGESAFLRPGHPPQIGKGSSGTIYVDDFEGSTSSVDLRFPLTSWALASTPAGNGLFPEATLNDSLPYGFNRAKLAWYNIEPTLQDNTNSNNPVAGYQNFGDPRINAISVQQLFPQQTPQFGQAQLVTFDLAYYPYEKGPYNFDVKPFANISAGVDANGRLLKPATRWGGIMRAIDQTDFETNNIQYIEFWMQNPFLLNPNSNGGQLYFDLGNVSEDIVKDGKKMYENGLPTPNITAATDTSVWGKVPLNPTQITNAFSNDPTDRPYQDVGFDGLNDDSERVQFSSYLSKMAASFGTTSAVYQKALNDPSSDDFVNYRDASYDQAKTDILGRYKQINNPQGNSPVASTGSQYVSAATMYPDQEDLNHDNTLNQLEAYFEYKVNLTPAGLSVGSNYITDSRSFTPSGGTPQTWYQFRIPINAYTQNVGNVPDFKSIQFIRMYLNGFSDSALVFRFAELQLIRDSWRNFNYVVDTTGNYTLLPVTGPTSFNVTAVNIEQNSTRTPIPYVIPPGIERQQSLSTNNTNVLLNEQAMSLQICNLANGDARGVYKTVNLDLRKYGKMDMFIHTESAGGTNYSFNSGDLSAVVRLGSDFVSNYYEIRIPLIKTNWYDSVTTDIWPDSNNLNLSLNRLIQLKEDRNLSGNTSGYFRENDPSGRSYAIIGNPNLGAVQAFFLGVENARQPNSICTEVWFDELRLSDINDQGGWAAVGRVDMKLADIGTAYVSGSHKSAGFGSIDQHINERSTDNITQLDAATSLQLGKLLPKKAAVSVPVYASISQSTSKPQYDPFDLDIKLKDKLKAAPPGERDSIKAQAVDATTIKTINFTNVKKNNVGGKKLKPWSIENFDFSYSYTRSEHHNSIAVEDEYITNKAGLGYNYAHAPKYLEPFKRRIKSKSPWYSLVRDLNLNLVPSVLSFRADVNRQFGAYRSRNIGGPVNILPETFNKYFNFNRNYVLRWDFTKSLNLDFSAINLAVVDEDSGRLDKTGRRHMWNNFFKGGRNLSYQQTASITYTLPTNKLPLIDWTSVHVGYGSTYGWTAASLLATTLGNTLQNTQQKSITGEFDFTRLYSKWRWMRALEPVSSKPGAQKNNTGSIGKTTPDLSKNKSDTTKNKSNQLKNPNQLPELNALEKGLGRILTAIKHMSVNYSENSASTIYGYLDSTQLLGMDLRTGQPGLGYIFGKQPGANFVDHLAQKGLITHDTTLNFQNLQSFNQKLNITAQLQPIRDLSIDINFDKNFGKTYSELFKDTTGGGNYAHLNPYTGGTFSVSFISIKTLFEKNRPDQVSQTFQKFEGYRAIISSRLGNTNPYSGSQNPDGYYKGYGQYSQDVLIPAFIAAYTGKDPKTISLINENNSSIRSNPFSGYLPRPNWRIAYNGLNKIPGFDKIFTSFNVTDAYTSTLSMGGFTSSLLYQDPFGIRYPGFIDTTSGNFVPFFAVPNLTINEQFAPLLNVDMQFVNSLQARVGFNKSRQLSLSLIDYQMTESRSTEFTIGGGWKKKGLPIPFKIKMPGKTEASKKLDNTLTVRLDVSIRDDVTSNTYLDQTAALPTGGQKVITVSPSIDYVLSNRINLKLYFDQRKVEPKISSSPPITTTRGGLQIRISLAP
jgi:cell surface protein SprA